MYLYASYASKFIIMCSSKKKNIHTTNDKVMKMLNNQAKIKFTFRLVESYKKSFKKRMIYFYVLQS